MMGQTKKLISLLLLMCFCIGLYAQNVVEKHIVSDKGDSVYIKSFRCAFDTLGNYYFETPVSFKKSKFSIVTPKHQFKDAHWSPNVATTRYKATITDAYFSDTSGKKIIIKNKLSTIVRGPFNGRVREVLEFGKDNIAFELVHGSQSTLYINDSAVNTIDSTQQRWQCSFSDNGNVIYSFYKNGQHLLFVNYKCIDSSKEPFIEIGVSDNGFYAYGTQMEGNYYVKAGAKVFGPFGAIDYADVWSNGAYYFRGCHDSSCYVLVNGHTFSIPESHYYIEDAATEAPAYRSDEQISVEPFGPDNFLMSYNQQGDTGYFINFNGKISRFDYLQAGYIFPGNNNDFAFYGTHYDIAGMSRVYKSVNGKEQKMVPYKRGRFIAHGLTVAPDGTSVYYNETKDSVFIYCNDKLLCPPASKDKFQSWDGADVFPQYFSQGLEYFRGLNINNETYLVYNNSLSRALPLLDLQSGKFDEPKRGAIVAGALNAHGFFMIVCLDKGKYLLDINNTHYEELTGIDEFLGDQSYLLNSKLIFYARKGKDYYEYTVKY